MSAPVILTLANYYLPGYKAGGPITTLANMISRLGADFRFRIVTRDRDFGDRQGYEKIIPNSWQTAGNAEICYLSAGRKGVSKLNQILSEPDYDVLYLNSFFSQTFTLRPLLSRYRESIPKRPVVLAPRGELAPGALRLKRWKKIPFVQTAKLMGLYRGLIWQASCPHEQADIRKYFGDGVSIHVAPDLTAPLADSGASQTFPAKKAGELKLLFLSRICRMKNLLFVLKILKNIQGNVDFRIFGPIEDEKYWDQCRRLISELPANVTVRYAGIVTPSQVHGIIREHDLFILPTLGENFGHVIIEALSSWCPVLISDRTLWKGLESHAAGWEVPLEQVERFRQVLQECIDMPTRQFHRLREGARSYALKHASSDDVILQQNRDLFLSALEEHEANCSVAGRTRYNAAA